MLVKYFYKIESINTIISFRSSNPEIRDFMAKFDFAGEYRLLESIYIKKLLNIVSSYPTNNGYILWQEVFDNGIQVKNDTIIHVWKVIIQTEVHHKTLYITCRTGAVMTGRARWKK